MSKQQLQSEETKQLSVTEQLDEMGLRQGIPRNEDESDADYAERLVYELDVYVEEIWAVQDEVRELIPIVESST